MPDKTEIINHLKVIWTWAATYNIRDVDCPKIAHYVDDAIRVLEAQEQRHRLEVHNIGNVDVPEGVTWEQFQAVMSGVVKALEHTDRGESWPYDEDRR